MKKKNLLPYDEFSKAHSEQELNLFSIFVQIKMNTIQERAKVTALKNFYGPDVPVADIYGKNKTENIPNAKKYPKRKKLIEYLDSADGQNSVNAILAESKSYNELKDTYDKKIVSVKLAEAFDEIKDMMSEDFNNGKEITALSRYVKRNGVSPFERERSEKTKETSIKNLDFEKYLDEILNDNIANFEHEIARTISEKDFIVSLCYANYYDKEVVGAYPPHFTKEKIGKELTEVRDDFFEMRFLVPIAKGDYKFKTHLWFRDRLDEKIQNLAEYSHKRDSFGNKITHICCVAQDNLFAQLKERFPRERLKELIAQNSTYTADLEKYKKKAQKKNADRQTVLNRIPEHYRDSFPEARMMHRKFVLHIGPTNSGKTHDAIEKLKSSLSGIYLAPLRLLAFEQYETLTEAGVPCNMITGEERILTDDACIQSSTIEMLPLNKRFDVAVIDEAQLIDDINRGGAWCSAMYGVLAYEVHVCAAPEAEDILKQIVKDCGDEYEIVYHERLTELKYSDERFEFPKDVQAGDALICFSRKSVHAIATELVENGFQTSVIYGSLPYDVRHHEAERFANGETSVVVATDAIGMGMNLPIKRIVFMETKKFDGFEVRNLSGSEVRQIAGRAGRFGKYPIGIAQAREPEFLEKSQAMPVRQIEKVRINFPDSLATVPGKLSKTMQIWQELPTDSVFEKVDINQLIDLTKWCEKHTSKKNITIQFVKIPFDVKNSELLVTWQRLFLSYLHGECANIESYITHIYHPESKSLEDLEHQHSYLDLLYNYCDRFDEKWCDDIMQKKEKISEMIMEILKAQVYQKRTCKHCGKKLPWNSKYTMCNKCHDRLYPRRYWDDDFYYLR